MFFLHQATIHLQAESGELVGVEIAHTRAGANETYVTGFDSASDKIVLTFSAKPGLYRARVRYSSPGQPKGFQMVLNGRGSDGMFKPTDTGFAWQDAGLFELAANNKLEFRNGWGWYDLDAIDFIPAKPLPLPKAIAGVPVNPNATPEAKGLLQRLARGYGKRIGSGQYDLGDCEFIRAKTGRSPLIEGADFMEYSPSRIERGSKLGNATEKMIEQAKRGAIVTFSWHWNAPSHLIDKLIKDKNGREIDARWYKGFYTNATTFDLVEALKPSSPNHWLLLRDIDRIAVELKKLQKAHVPVLWRPLHEAEGGWFWWGAKGPEPFKKLWVLMYDRLTHHHRLSNLVWVYSSGTKPEWYPGDSYVDVVGIDAYPSDRSDPLTATWEQLLRRFDGKKMLAITEFGGLPDPSRMFKFGARWSYWVSWVGDLGPRKESLERLRGAYLNPLVITRK